jgi:aminoglycoside phosphotransferase (APT) family kinase protein
MLAGSLPVTVHPGRLTLVSLSREALEWVRHTTGAAVAAAETLPGATSATVHRLVLQDGTHLVMKRFDRDDPFDRRPDRAAHEAGVLELLTGSAVPVPRLVACDPRGEESGAPSVLMVHVAGSAAPPAGWLDASAAMAARIAEVDSGDLDWRYARYNRGVEWLVPEWAADPGVWRGVFDVIDADPPEGDWCFIHRDLHPGNLIWQGDRIAAVIDWLSGCIGPPAIDGAHFLVNLIMDLGREAGEVFMAGYLARLPAGRWHPFWALVDAIDFLPFWDGPAAVDRWRWDDRPAAVTRGVFEGHLRTCLTAAGV